MPVFRVKSRTSGRTIRIEGASLLADGNWLYIKSEKKETIAIFEAGAVDYAIDEDLAEVLDS